MASSSDDEFSTAVGPLAHHLYPDGCYLEELVEIWPTRTNRSPIPPKQALQSIKLVREFALRRGLTPVQLSLVTVLACATLPNPDNTISVGAGSPLVDGTSQHFRTLIQSLIPASIVPQTVVCRILSIPHCDHEGRKCILRFLTLCIRKVDVLDQQSYNLLDKLYAILFQATLQAETCADAVRLLLLVTRRYHVRKDRAIRLQSCWEANPNKFAAIPSLLHLYARLRPDKCTTHAAIAMSGASKQWFAFPDTQWERDFYIESLTSPPCKRMRREEQGTVLSTLQSLRNIVDGGSNSQNWSQGSSGTELLQDEQLRHLLAMDNETEMVRLRAILPLLLHEEWYRLDDVHTDQDDSEQIQENDPAATAQKLAEVPSTKDESFWSSRIRLLSALVNLASHTDSLPPEAETFLVQDVLPMWDGTDDMGLLLCHDLLPILSPRNFSDLRSKVLIHLESLFLYGSPRIHYAIISGALASLVNRWGRLDWSCQMEDRPIDDIEVLKVRSLKELIQWTDDLLLKGFLACGGHELLRSAAVDFFAAVCDLTDHCTFLAAPSPPLTYRLLLSTSSLHIDRVCNLLVKYKTTFQKLKQRQQEGQDDAAASGLDRVKVFNCYVWDFCSVLWRSSPPPSPHANETSRTFSILYTDLRPETQTKLHAAADQVASALSITHGSVFCGYALDFLRSEQLDANSDLIKGRVKVEYLDYLKTSCGLHGLHLFLTTFVESLAQRSASVSASNKNNSI